uniref:Uncharacterized protein n=1 Tax=Parascaris univalens TaxID=6257 RepID=A0A914ZMF6_PARUN
VHSTAIHFKSPDKSETTSNTIVASPSSKKSSSLEMERITLPFPPIAETTISTSSAMLQTTSSQYSLHHTTSGDEASATVRITTIIEKSLPKDANFSYISEEVT